MLSFLSYRLCGQMAEAKCPSPDVDFVLSICLQSNFPTKQAGKPGTASKQLQGVAAPSSSDISGSNKSHILLNSSSYKPTRDRQTGKRKDFDKLFDLKVLEGEIIREWLFFDKPRRAFESGNQKQGSLPDYKGRGWHESRKQA